MATAAQRKWAAKHRAAAAAEPKKYASVRIKSSVDRAKAKTEKAMEAAASVGREYRGPTPAQVAAGTLEVGTPTTAHREAARVAALQRIPKEPLSVPSIIPDTRGQLTIPSLPLVQKVKPTVPKYPLLEGLEKYAVAPPVEMRRRPPVTTGVVPLYEPVQEIKRRIIAGYGLGIGEPVDIKKMKPPEEIVPFKEYVTAPVYEKATELTKRYKEWMEKQGIVEVPTGVVGEVIEPLRRFGIGIVRTPALLAETAGMVPLGVEFAVREPIVAGRMAPIGIGVMAGGLVTSVRERPFETIGEFTGMMLGPKVITKVVPAPKIPTMLHIPVRQRIPTLPAGLIPSKIVKFRAGAGIAAALEKAAPPIKKPLDFTQVKALGKAGKGVEAWIKAHPEQETVIGGSAAARTQLKGARQPGDIDINVGDVSKAASELYEVVSKVHGKDKTKVSFYHEYGSAKVKVKTNGWHDAVDIHPTIAPGTLLRESFPYKVQKPVRIGGIDYVPLGELIQRKAESILQSRRASTIGPEEWRLKDVTDFERFVSEALEHKFTKAQTAKMFTEYRKGKVKALEQELIEYKTHVAYGPDPYQIRAAAVKYEKLPVTVKLPAAALVTAAPYPREYKPIDEVTKVPSVYPPYKPPREPVYDVIGEIPYKPVKYKPPYKPPYAPPAYPPYRPPYKPYEPAYAPPPYTPPYEPTKYKLPYLPEDEKKVRVAKKRRPMKGFQYFIENPISSPFGMSSVGKMKQK